MEEETNTVSAETGANEPMSFDSALSILNEADTPVEETPAAPETAEAGETGDEADNEPDVPKTGTEAEPEADTEAPEYLHGNARTRLRDGSEVTIGELKKAYDEAKEYRVNQAKFDAQRQEFEAKQAQIAAQENYFNQTLQQAKSVLEANFPPKPDYAALEKGEIDIITFNEMKAKRDHAEEKWRQLTHAQQVQAQKAQQQQAETVRAHVQRETQLLKDAVPELRTDEGFKAFKEDLLTHAPKEYGFTSEELANLADHRALRVLKDAIAYRKLQAAKPKALEKAKDAPPVAAVQPPSRRPDPSERQAQVVKQGFDRLRKTGSFDDALAILNQIDS